MGCATRLTLEPLRVDHASEMLEVLGDPALYEFTGGRPPTLEELTARYALQVTGTSPDGAEEWRNWIVRSAATAQAIGYVQATIRRTERSADLAWVIGTRWWGLGYATEAASAMAGLLRADDIAHFTAHISPGHGASERVARKVGLHPTIERVDGEVVYTSCVVGTPGHAQKGSNNAPGARQGSSGP
ncbi:GNAT family N-acetyltransferase [Kocuria sp. cx-455]|uniref:GNAT family N-acetyltransferase n=1 Tax=unclassified Candidatus Sulfotelmatobacter TaxID=2635724 RepID=UPI001683CD67|nr:MULTISPECIES: GNAT family N-acetyltransferase [unclassified Candidatus Sulfotelmatobacter]MBD2762956.1 GNAT family N-acetyltransferase [Kocuria sp. cx-116]MBD2766002.1 GNAT family N-acetyltransferase [Kocuria sp. cx-455]